MDKGRHAADSSDGPLLELRGVAKSFAGIPALKPLDLAIGRGDVVGLIGENGAGKSTLIKILSGNHLPDAGTILWDGQEVRFRNPRHAQVSGVATIHQELACFERLTVAENLFLGEPWPRRAWGGTDWAALHAAARTRLAAFELDLDPKAFLSALSPAQRQEIAIARALGQNARLLILDEPTASLSEPEVRRLLGHLDRLKESRVTIFYVSHRLEEILKITNRVVVLRDGAMVAQFPAAEASVTRMVREMVGREPAVRLASERPRVESAEPVFEAKNLGKAGLFKDVSFQITRGEILGLGGLVGAGRSELARCLFGLYAPDHGTMRFRGRAWRPRSPADAVVAGLAYVPEERKRQGLVTPHSLANNMSITWLRRWARLGIVREHAEREQVEAAIAGYGVRTRGPEQPVGTLSGGNQQKALLARWLELDPAVVILDEPTRGVDVGAKAEIHRMIAERAARGQAILLISSDLPELLALSHRVLVLHQGRIERELSGVDLTQENVLFAASGLRPEVAGQGT